MVIVLTQPYNVSRVSHLTYLMSMTCYNSDYEGGLLWIIMLAYTSGKFTLNHATLYNCSLILWNVYFYPQKKT